jgi:hypothetical protein
LRNGWKSEGEIGLKQVYSYSHLGGEEILMVRYPRLFKEIEEVIESITEYWKDKKER